MKRIGITQRVEVVADYGEVRDCLDQSWTRLGEELNLLLIPLSNLVTDVPGYLDQLALDGVILSGGNDLADLPDARSGSQDRDRFEYALLSHCNPRDTPVLGVCRGMQMLSRFHGGQVTPVSGHRATRHAIIPESAGLRYWPGPVEVNSFHDYGIETLPPKTPLQVLARDPAGAIEAFFHRERPQYAIMWHPERETEFAKTDLEFIRGVFSG